ncbi:atrial natriuretic peptide-converting enzyme-like [Branchiostoma floridae]|uniref:Atrial natriuretic peptide-converting enzyme-like n=1 Tax=Branchiostoma floridae TaxID=7739 RepID=A0A9J7HSB0_BRAFL|nr:atrial natriuretic peptide-converting enzyme-like [Branchiostoma floridae]
MRFLTVVLSMALAVAMVTNMADAGRLRQSLKEMMRQLIMENSQTTVPPTQGARVGDDKEKNTVACGGDLTGTSGTLASPNYPNNYPDSADCKWRIMPPRGGPVTLQFQDLQTENGYDHVSVYDGLTINDPLIGKLTGNTAPADPISGTNTLGMLVVFTSDYSLNEKGFTATYASDGNTPTECTQYTCPSSRECIHWSWLCDDVRDCADGSDENNCFQCDADKRKPSKMPQSWVCDGITDCHDEADESNCNDEQVFEATWSAWSEWSECSAECEGTRQRTRTCNVPEGAPSYITCTGNDVQIEACGTPGPCSTEPQSGCGTRQSERSNERIINGQDAQRGAWPWQVQLKRGSGSIPFCGGTLIDREWVLSAAHCFHGFNWRPTDLHVVIGAQNLRTPPIDQGSIVVTPLQFFVKEDYDPNRINNDIALIKIPPVDYPTDYINSACLPEAQEVFNGNSLCFTTGWGVTDEGRMADVLQEARVPLIDNGVCNGPTSYAGALTDKMLCAGYLAGGIDACQGDSGGPLVCQNSQGRWSLVGITSWGYGCASENFPGVYARVQSFLPWIADKMAANREFIDPEGSGDNVN